MNIDWNKMPDATHWHPMTDRYSDHWFKPGFFCVCGFESGGWVEDLVPIQDRSEYVARPVEDAEQIAEKQREQFVRECKNLASTSDWADIFYKMYDAGYRKCP